MAELDVSTDLKVPRVGCDGDAGFSALHTAHFCTAQ